MRWEAEGECKSLVDRLRFIGKHEARGMRASLRGKEVESKS